MKNKILIIEDDATTAAILTGYLKSEGYDIVSAHNGHDGLSAMEAEKPQGVLLDLNLPDMHGFDILKSIRERHPATAIIVITGAASMTTAVEAMQCGAHDFVPKPASPERLKVSVRNALERVELKEIAKTYEKIAREEFQDFVGKSPKMQAVYTILESAAQSKASVFITGESGTGKELAARAVHNLSARSHKSFEVLNCAAIPHNLLESEIFGHVKGAFTGATSGRKGAAARADGGTLFLDELGEMPMALQAKLLRFIQSGTFMAVGDTRTQRVDVRFICATNRDPLSAVKDGFLREDLYYRLNVIPVPLPPLRERGGDVMRLARYFLEKISDEEGKDFQTFSLEAESILTAYRWPGNVRELENTIRRIVVLGKGKIVEPPMLSILHEHAKQAPETPPGNANIDIQPYLPRTPGEIKPLKVYEREAIMAALSACNGNITEASKRLDINPATIHRKQKQWKQEGG
ncbi:MAG: sigma-54 dependent transcriptional regulator [Alphaproteobacteria bacterium]